MAQEIELLRQQLAVVTTYLAERDATLIERDATPPTERALRISAEAAAQGDTAGRSGRPIQQASVAQPMPEPDYRHQIPPALMLSSQNSMRVLKFDLGSQLRLWSHRLQNVFDGAGSDRGIEPTNNPIRIAGGLGAMEERNRSIYPHGQQKVEKCEKAW